MQTRAYCGVHYTNDHNATERGRDAVRVAQIEAAKVFNYTNVVEAEALRAINPDIRFLCRLWSGRFGPIRQGPSPEQFVADVEVGLDVWLPYCNRFVIHNEPNLDIEGWGFSEAEALDFNEWYLAVLVKLRARFPIAQFGFPGLAPHANDLEWLGWCAPAIEASDFLCAHCYWDGGGHLDRSQGLRYLDYLEIWPDKELVIGEWGNVDHSSIRDWNAVALEYIEWMEHLWVTAGSFPDGSPRIRGTYSFILESHDDAWQRFAWVDRDGAHRPIVSAVGAMDRPPLFGEPTPPLPPEPGDVPTEAIRNKAWNSVAGGVAYNPAAGFPAYARQHGLGAPLTSEVDEQGYRLQGFVGGIVFCVVPQWNLIEHMKW